MQSRLRQERLRRGLSLTRLTIATGISTSSLSQLERGLVPAHPGWQKKIAAALDMPMGDLFAERRNLPPLAESA